MSNSQSLIPKQLSDFLSLSSKLFDVHKLFDSRYEDEILQAVVDALVETYGYSVAYFRMLAPDGYLEIKKYAGVQNDTFHNPKERRMSLEEGINGYAISARKMVVISDVRNNSMFKYPEVRERENLIGMLAIPLFSAGRPIGVLSCYTREPHVFTEEEQQFASALANMTSVILNNNRFLEEINILDEFSQELAKKSDLTDVLQTIVTYAQRFSGANGVRLFPYDPEKNLFALHLEAGVGIGQGKGLSQHRRPRKDGITMQVLENEIIRLEGDEISNSHLLGQETKKILQEEGVKAFAGLAVKTKVPVGVIYLNYKNPTDMPRYEDLQKKFHRLLRHAALAIERAWLFENRQQEQKLLEFTSNLVSNAHHVKEVWQDFLNHAMRATDAPVGSISVIGNDVPYLERLVHSGLSGYLDKVHRIDEVSSSIQSEVFRRKESILIRNLLVDEGWKGKYPDHPNARSILAVPVYAYGSAKQKVIGVIDLEHYEDSYFDEHNLRLIELLSMQVTIVLKIAEDYEQIRREGMGLNAFRNTAQVLINRPNQKNVLEVILQEAVNLTGANFATIQKLIDEHLVFQEILPSEQWDALHRRLPGGRMRLDGGGITVQTAKERRPIMDNDITANPSYWDGNNGQTQSEIAIPMLLDNGQVWGVLNVEKKVKNGFTLEDQDILTALSQLALSAVQSDEYYINLQRDQNVSAISHALSYLVQVHWLNNQISLMPAEADTMLDKIRVMPLEDDIKDTLRKHLHTIIENGHRITDQISKIYRPFKGELGVVDISEVCNIAKNSIPVPETIDVAFDFDLSALNILGTRDMLVMILENIFQNSIRHMPDGGNIWIKTEVLEPEWLYFRIYDDGLGISPDNLKRISRFSFDLSVKDAQSDKGLGLGLPLAYWYARKMGGYLQIESNNTPHEQGTLITLKLPRATDQQRKRLESLVLTYAN